MNWTKDELNLVFEFLRARTVDKTGHRVPRSLLMGLMRRWAEDHGYSARPDNRTCVALFERAGYAVVRERVNGKARQFVEGLDLAPKREGDR